MHLQVRSSQLVKLFSISCLAVFALAPSGCQGVDTEAPAPEVETTQRALGPGFVTHDCNLDDTVKINEAMGVLFKAVASSGFSKLQTCMANAALVENNCQLGSEIAVLMRQSNVTNILCSALGCTTDASGNTTCRLAEAPVRIVGEQLTLDRGFLTNSDTTEVAAVIAHEIMHNRGFNHSENDFGSTLYPNTVPEQMRACIRGTANAWQGPGPQPPHFTPKCARDACLAVCNTERDACMADAAEPGGPRPQECVAQLRVCRSACPN